jgi:four helix bundle protein
VFNLHGFASFLNSRGVRENAVERHRRLAYQLRKSAVSIPSNIAEGSRLKTPSYAHHLVIALGSHAELDTQCELATRRRLIKSDDQARLEHLIDEVGRIIHGLARSL